MTCGSGAAFSVEKSPSTGTFPSKVFFFQQRLGFANTNNQPMTLWASRVDQFENWSSTGANTDADPYSYTVDANSLDPIRAAISVQNGLLVFTASGVAQLTGPQTGIVTANQGSLVFQTFVGSSSVRPQVVGNEILYVRDQSRSIELLTFNPNARRFDSSEISVMSRHLFRDDEIRAIAFTHATNRRGIGVFRDGTGVMMTVDSVQQVFAFSELVTQGQMRDVTALQSGQEEEFYLIVERDGYVSLERMKEAPTNSPEEELWLDSALRLNFTRPNANITIKPTDTSGEYVIEATKDIFTSAMVTDPKPLLGAGSGTFFPKTLTSASKITVEARRPPSENASVFKSRFQVSAGDWWLSDKNSRISGAHFRGQRVVFVVDGELTASIKPTVGEFVVPEKLGPTLADVACGVPDLAGGLGWGSGWNFDWGGTLSGGQGSGFSITIGLPYGARVETLPIPTTPGHRSNIGSVELMMGRFENFCIGRVDADEQVDFGKYFYEALDKTSAERPLQTRPTNLHIPLTTGWDRNGSIFLQAQVGQPLEILQMVLNDQSGDELHQDRRARR